MLGFLKNVSPVEWLIIVLILVILFGPKLVKSLGRASGETVRELKNVKKSFTDAVEGKEEKSEE